MTSDRTNNFSYYNLDEIVQRFDAAISDALFICCEKFINTIYKNGGNRKVENLNLLEEIRKGCTEQIIDTRNSLDDVLKDLNSSNFIEGFKFVKDENGDIILIPES